MSPLTRRGALLAGAAGVAALSSGAGADSARAGVGGDAAVLQPLHRDEMFALAVYGTVALNRVPRVRELGRRFRPQEAKHVAALATALEALGAPRFEPPRGRAALDEESRRVGIAPVFSTLHGPEAVLGFLETLEDRLVQGWLDAHVRLGDANLVQMASEVLGCQAQHLVALRAALGRPLLPDAFESGRS